MSRPDRVAIIAATPSAAATIITAAAGIAYDLPYLAIPAAGALLITAATLAALWNIPTEDDLMTIADATRERPWPTLPSQWTPEDWAELERDVKGLNQ